MPKLTFSSVRRSSRYGATRLLPLMRASFRSSYAWMRRPVRRTPGRRTWRTAATTAPCTIPARPAAVRPLAPPCVHRRPPSRMPVAATRSQCPTWTRWTPCMRTLSTTCCAATARRCPSSSRTAASAPAALARSTCSCCSRSTTCRPFTWRGRQCLHHIHARRPSGTARTSNDPSRAAPLTHPRPVSEWRRASPYLRPHVLSRAPLLARHRPGRAVHVRRPRLRRLHARATCVPRAREREGRRPSPRSPPRPRASPPAALRSPVGGAVLSDQLLYCVERGAGVRVRPRYEVAWGVSPQGERVAPPTLTAYPGTHPSFEQLSKRVRGLTGASGGAAAVFSHLPLPRSSSPTT